MGAEISRPRREALVKARPLLGTNSIFGGLVEIVDCVVDEFCDGGEVGRYGGCFLQYGVGFV